MGLSVSCRTAQKRLNLLQVDLLDESLFNFGAQSIVARLRGLRAAWSRLGRHDDIQELPFAEDGNIPKRLSVSGRRQFTQRRYHGRYHGRQFAGDEKEGPSQKCIQITQSPSQLSSYRI